MIEIRSFRRVFDLERRIYRIDRLRLNPGGVPVRGIVYLLATLAALELLRAVPIVGLALARLPWYLLYAGIPIPAAALLTMVRLEGRTVHQAVVALVRCELGTSRRIGLRRRPAARSRWSPDPVVVLPDGSDARLREMRFTGPGAVLIATPHDRRVDAGARRWGRGPRRPQLVLRPSRSPVAGAPREVIVLDAGTRLRVHGRTAEGARR